MNQNHLIVNQLTVFDEQNVSNNNNNNNNQEEQSLIGTFYQFF